MGCGSSAFDNAMRDPEFRQNLKLFQAMRLSNGEIRRLYKVFRKVDFDGSGSIGLPELLAHIDLPRTAFTEKIFSIFDEDNSGEIDFKEFVLSVWNYCTLTKVTLDVFAFDLYDRDGSGELSATEILHMLQDIFGKNEMKSNVHVKIMASELRTYEDNTESFDIENFQGFVRTHQNMLFPVFQMQLALQRKVLGVRFWERNAQRRMKLSNGKYVSIGQFILEHTELTPEDHERRQQSKAAARAAKQAQRDTNYLAEHSGSKAHRKKKRNGSDSGNMSSFSDSAKRRFEASMKGVAAVASVISGKYSRKKVHVVKGVTAKGPQSNATIETNVSIISTLGYDSPLQQRSYGHINTHNSYNDLNHVDHHGHSSNGHHKHGNTSRDSSFSHEDFQNVSHASNRKRATSISSNHSHNNYSRDNSANNSFNDDHSYGLNDWEDNSTRGKQNNRGIGNFDDNSGEYNYNGNASHNNGNRKGAHGEYGGIMHNNSYNNHNTGSGTLMHNNSYNNHGSSNHKHGDRKHKHDQNSGDHSPNNGSSNSNNNNNSNNNHNKSGGNWASQPHFKVEPKSYQIVQVYEAEDPAEIDQNNRRLQRRSSAGPSTVGNNSANVTNSIAVANHLNKRRSSING